MSDQLHRDVRFLKLYAAGSTLLLIILSTAAFRQAPAERPRFEELDVERLNIVESDGRVRLVLSNSQRQAPAVVDGRVLLPDRSRPAGMLFFNEEGDEVGGLIFSGQLKDGTAQASGSLTFDQWKQDQTVALQYAEGQGTRRAGLAVIDRPKAPITEMVDLLERRETATSDSERASLDEELERYAAMSPRRMFVGKDVEGNATLVLSDAQGQERLVLSVADEGMARIRFFDQNGEVVRELAP